MGATADNVAGGAVDGERSDGPRLRRGRPSPPTAFLLVSRNGRRTPPPNCGGGVGPMNPDASKGIWLRPRGAPSPGLSPKKPWGRGDALEEPLIVRSNSPLSVRNERGGAGGGAPCGRSSMPAAAL